MFRYRFPPHAGWTQGFVVHTPVLSDRKVNLLHTLCRYSSFNTNSVCCRYIKMLRSTSGCLQRLIDVGRRVLQEIWAPVKHLVSAPGKDIRLDYLAMGLLKSSLKSMEGYILSSMGFGSGLMFLTPTMRMWQTVSAMPACWCYKFISGREHYHSMASQQVKWVSHECRVYVASPIHSVISFSTNLLTGFDDRPGFFGILPPTRQSVTSFSFHMNLFDGASTHLLPSCQSQEGSLEGKF